MTVQGPVKKQRPNGMPCRGGGVAGCFSVRPRPSPSSRRLGVPGTQSTRSSGSAAGAALPSEPSPSPTPTPNPTPTPTPTPSGAGPCTVVLILCLSGLVGLSSRPPFLCVWCGMCGVQGCVRMADNRRRWGGYPPPPRVKLSAQISATTKRGCRPWAGPPWGPGNRGAGLLLPPPPPPQQKWGRKQAQHSPPPQHALAPPHPHCRPSHGDQGPSPHGQGADAERWVCWDLGPAW